MTNLEQSQKKVTQLKETLKKERAESQNLKRKYENMIGEVEVSKAEFQTLQADKDALVVFAENTDKNAQTTLSEFGKLQQQYQSLEAKRDELRLLVEELNKENRELEGKVKEV